MPRPARERVDLLEQNQPVVASVTAVAFCDDSG